MSKPFDKIYADRVAEKLECRHEKFEVTPHNDVERCVACRGLFSSAMARAIAWNDFKRQNTIRMIERGIDMHAVTSTVGCTPPNGSGLTLEKVHKAMELLRNAPPPPEPDHLAARKDTLDYLTKAILLVKAENALNQLYGMKVVIDESVAPGCVEMRDKSGRVLAICGGIRP